MRVNILQQWAFLSIDPALPDAVTILMPYSVTRSLNGKIVAH